MPDFDAAIRYRESDNRISEVTGMKRSPRRPNATQPADDHDLGLPHDLETLIARRGALALLGAAGLAGLLSACGDDTFVGRAEAEVTGTDTRGNECVADPRETPGPFPADGSNNAHGTLANVLVSSGIVRADMRSSLDPSKPVAAGTSLDLQLKLLDVGHGCTPLAGHAIYLWHCDAVGRYSMYDLPDATYLRAVGLTDTAGNVSFKTIFPGCYPGRFPHMHFEVYPNLDKATSYANRILTSQLAMPQAVCEAVYRGAADYGDSLAHFARSPLARDGIFSDNTQKQLAAQTPTLSGTVAGGYSGGAVVGIKA
jgi:protocatechuate 3,4-dioxygenase beta subunit